MEDKKICMMNEVAMPEGLMEAGIVKDITCEEICPKCGKKKSECACNK